MKNSQKKLVQGGALDARKKLGEKVNSPGPGPILIKKSLPIELSSRFLARGGTLLLSLREEGGLGRHVLVEISLPIVGD